MSAAPPALDPQVAGLLRRTDDGLVAAVVQQHDTGEVLMLAWMDDEALHRTLTTGRATYWSRSRGEYWVKGETSGHRQWVRDVRLDCDGDALLVLVDQEGPACHTGERPGSPRPAPREGAGAGGSAFPAPRARNSRGSTSRSCRSPAGSSPTGRPPSASTASSRPAGPARCCWNRPSRASSGRGSASSACAAPVYSPSVTVPRNGWGRRSPGSPTTCRPTRWPPSGAWPARCARRAPRSCRR